MDLSLFERESLFNEMEADVSIMPTIPNHSTPLHELPLQEMPGEIGRIICIVKS